MIAIQLRGHTRGQRAQGHTGHRQGLGAHAPRFEGRHFLRATSPTARASIRSRSSRPNTLANYADEVLHLTAGCAVEATGMIVPSPAKGQPFEMQASAIKVVGWVEDPTPTRFSRSRTRSNSCARSRTCGRAPTSSAR